MTEEIKKEKPKTPDFLSDLFRWRIDEESLEYQMLVYNEKGFRPIRKQIVILLTAFIVLTVAVLPFLLGVFPNPIEILMNVVLIIFIYKGSKLATGGMIIYYTINQIAKILLDSNNFVMVVIWWLLVMSILWKNYQVENEMGRRRKIELIKEMKKTDTESPKEHPYCVECGNEMDSENKFCFKCGAKIKKHGK